MSLRLLLSTFFGLGVLVGTHARPLTQDGQSNDANLYAQGLQLDVTFAPEYGVQAIQDVPVRENGQLVDHSMEIWVPQRLIPTGSAAGEFYTLKFVDETGQGDLWRIDETLAGKVAAVATGVPDLPIRPFLGQIEVTPATLVRFTVSYLEYEFRIRARGPLPMMAWMPNLGLEDTRIRFRIFRASPAHGRIYGRLHQWKWVDEAPDFGSRPDLASLRASFTLGVARLHDATPRVEPSIGVGTEAWLLSGDVDAAGNTWEHWRDLDADVVPSAAEFKAALPAKFDLSLGFWAYALQSVSTYPPAIAVQPQGQTATSGATVAFTVLADAEPAATYQWYKDGVALVGSTGASLTLANVSPHQAGSYHVRVTNPHGSIDSAAASLVVSTSPPPTGPVVIQPQPLPGASGPLNLGAGSLQPAGGGAADLLAATVFRERYLAAGRSGILISAPVRRGSWQALATAHAVAYLGLAANGANAVAVGESGAIAVTADGNQWTAVSSPAGNTLRAVASGSGRWIAVGDAGTILTSTEPTVAWQTGASGTSNRLLAAGYDEVTEQWYVGGEGGTLRSSLAGQVWAFETFPAGGALAAIAFHRFDEQYSVGLIATEDGEVWIRRTRESEWTRDQSPAASSWYAAIATPQGHLLAGSSGVWERLANGAWEQRLPGTTAWRAMALEPKLQEDLLAPKRPAFIAVGADGIVQAGAVSSTSFSVVHPHAGLAPRVGEPFTLRAFTNYDQGAPYSFPEFIWTKDGATVPSSNAWTKVLTFDPLRETDLGKYVHRTKSNDAVVSAPFVMGAGRTGGLTNLSVRANAGAGEETMIAGFILDGGDLPLLVRGIGPGLTQYGVQQVVPDPGLVIRDQSNEITRNDDWHQETSAAAIAAAGARLGAFPLADGARDAAVHRSFAPGVYSAQVLAGTRGVALVELYADAGSTGRGRLRNISARVRVTNGEGALIAGFVIQDRPTKLLIRAVGPGLAAYGVQQVLSDPVLSLWRGQALVAANDRWDETAGTEIEAAAADVQTFPLLPGSADAAMVVTLEPGSYGAQIASADGTPGIALVEVYLLD